MILRKSDDICLLCQSNKATKKNSHVIPSFMGKSMLLTTDKHKRRGVVTELKKGELRQRPIQDIPKEDYILCPDCEKRFQVLETYVSRKLHDVLNNKLTAGRVTIKKIENKSYLELSDTNIQVFHLFIYSIIWRISISSRIEFSNFQLLIDEEESLRILLNYHLRSSHEDLFELIESIEGSSFQYQHFAIFTPSSKNSSEHMIVAEDNFRNPYLLVLNDFILDFTFAGNESRPCSFKPIMNNSFSPIKIGIVDESSWYENIAQFRRIRFNR